MVASHARLAEPLPVALHAAGRTGRTRPGVKPQPPPDGLSIIPPGPSLPAPAVDPFPAEYNIRRPHQALGMATPASRFQPVPEQDRGVLSLWLPAGLDPVEDPAVPADGTGYEGPGRGQDRSTVG